MDADELRALIVDMLDAMHWTDHDTVCPQYRRSDPQLRHDDYGEDCWACSVMRKAHGVAGWKPRDTEPREGTSD